MFTNLLRRRSPIVFYGVLAVLLAVLFYLGYRAGTLLIGGGAAQPTSPNDAAAPVSNGAVLVQPRFLVSDFTMTGLDGQSLSLSDLRGKPVMLFFGYTNCPDECPATMANYKRVKAALGDQADQIQFLFVSVDAQRDTPQVLAKFLGQFDDSFLGMTNGDPATLQQLGKEFGLVSQRVVLGADGSVEPAGPEAETYFVTHSSPIFMIDGDGYLNRLYFYGTDANVIAANLRDFLAS